MGTSKKRSRGASVVTTDAPNAAPPESGLLGVALLKVAMELKRGDGRSLEEIAHQVLTRMQLSEDDFRKYLAQNAGLLRTLIGRRG